MIEAARFAGDGLMVEFPEIDRSDVRHKNGPADPFSEADLRAEETVRAMLARVAPDYGFLGKEGGLVEGRDKRHVWIVDPLDGTANFLIGLPRSEEHTSELQSLMRLSYAGFCLKKKKPLTLIT